MQTRTKFTLMAAILGVTLLGMGIMLSTAFAQEEAVTGTLKSLDLGMAGVGAGIAIGFAGLGAGIGLGIAVSSIVAAGAEKPELIGRFFIFIVFIEAIAIYGLIISIFLITFLPATV